MKTLFFITGMIGLCMTMSDGYLFSTLNFAGCFVMALSVLLYDLFDEEDSEKDQITIGIDVHIKDWLGEKTRGENKRF